MAGGGGTGPNNNPNKIKGGRWTVAKFFSISVRECNIAGILHAITSIILLHSMCSVLQLAFTMVWMTIISQLGYYKILYGPQVLLQMNIAYFLPSIPLLGLSSQFDERLDQKFGKLDCKSHKQLTARLAMLPQLCSCTDGCRGCQDYSGPATDRPWRLCFDLCSHSI